jgi:hypothetical protein
MIWKIPLYRFNFKKWNVVAVDEWRDKILTLSPGYEHGPNILLVNTLKMDSSFPQQTYYCVAFCSILLFVRVHTWGRAMDQAVSSWLLTSETQLRAQFTLCGICNGKALGEVFLWILRFSLVSVIPLPPDVHSYIFWGMDKGAVKSPVSKTHGFTPQQK